MTLDDYAAIVIFAFFVIDVFAFLVLSRLSAKFPDIRSLRERRNVAGAIAMEMTLIGFLALNSRVMHWTLTRELSTAILLVAICATSAVNAVWLLRAVRQP